MKNAGLLGIAVLGVVVLTGCSGTVVSAPKPDTISNEPALCLADCDAEVGSAGSPGASVGSAGSSVGSVGASVGSAGASSVLIGAGRAGVAGGEETSPNALKLACFRYDEMLQQEVMYLVDPITGRTAEFGPLGDLAQPTILPAGDPETHRVYTVGTNQAGTRGLYVASGNSGALLETFPVSDYLNGLVVAPDGSLLYGSWNGTSEDLIRLDPESRLTQKIGTIGDLLTWAGLTAVDRASGLLYSEGTDASGQTKTYVNDTRTGALVRTLPAMRGASLQVDASGALIHLDWNGTQEQVISFNPLTSTDSVLGSVGNLLWWSGLNALDAPHHLLYVFGTPAMSSPTDNLYTVDTSSGQLVRTVTLGNRAAACVGL